MSDEQQVRSLLALAAEPPDEVQAPVQLLLDQGRRARRFRAAISVLGVAAVAAATFALPPIIRSLSHGRSSPAPTANQPPGPTAAQLSRFRWSALPPSPLGPRSQPLLAWTGKYLIELGGQRGLTGGETAYGGAAFDPATGRWHRIAQIPNNIGLTDALTIWTGHELFVTNGELPSHPPSPLYGAPAGLYDPASNQWSGTEMPRQLLGARQMVGAWTGQVILIAGILHGHIQAAALTPATRHWRMITPRLPTRQLPYDLALVATANRVILWSMWTRTKQAGNSEKIWSGVDVLTLGRGRWTTITGDWPQERVVEDPTFASGQILIPPGQIWCGWCPGPPRESQATLADSGTLALTTLPYGPLAKPLIEPPIWLWNGRTVVAGQIAPSMSSAPNGNVLTWLSRMAAYDPATGRWTVLPGPHGTVFMGANPLWAGRELLLLTPNGDLLAFHGTR